MAVPVRLTHSAVRETVQSASPGAYVLGNGSGAGARTFEPGYVGRSDVCVQTRLASHVQAGVFDYFIVQYAVDRREAFFLECEYWHAGVHGAARLANQIHPASPAGTALACPYCDFARGVMARYG
jgi:hypothetical protein